jgi:hypothetical protein
MIVRKYEVVYVHPIIFILHFSNFYFPHFHIFHIAQLVFEVTHSRNHHYKSFFLAKLNAVLIANGSTGLDKS